MAEYDDTTSFLREHASRALAQAIGSSIAITQDRDSPPNLSTPTLDYAVNEPPRDPPPSFADLFGDEDTSVPDASWLNQQAEAWMQEYFPSAAGQFRNLPEEWLAQVIGGVEPFGYSEPIFQLVWHKARDRAYRTLNTDVRNIEIGFAARGFSLPPGAMVDLVSQANQRASDAIQQVNLEQAVKDAEIKHDLLKFAVQIASTYRLGIMNAMADFYRSWVQVLDRDLDTLRVRTQAMASFYQALSTYYNVEVAFEQLRLRTAEIKAGLPLDIDKNKITLYGMSTPNADALGQAVRGFSDISSAAANAASTLVAQIETV